MILILSQKNSYFITQEKGYFLSLNFIKYIKLSIEYQYFKFFKMESSF